MSFSSTVRFEPEKGTRPVMFWEVAKQKKNNRKFSYKNRDQRYPVRHSHFGDHCEECRQNRIHKHDRKLLPSSNFIKKNIARVRNKNPPDRPELYHEKSFVNNVINRCSPRRRRPADTITLTDTQLNALLEAVKDLSPDSHNTIKFKLDGKLKQIQLSSEEDRRLPKVTSQEDYSEVQRNLDVEHKSDDDDEEEELPLTTDDQTPLERPRGVDRSGVFDGGSLSPIMDEVETSSNDEKSSPDFDQQEKGKLSAPQQTRTTKMATLPSATFSTSIWSDPGSSVDLPPLVPRAHLTLAEKKKPQWARERAEFEACYDPWRRGRVTKSSRSTSRPASILTDYPVMEDENKVLQKIQERTKWLTELEKQREEQRLQRFERQQADRKAFNSGFMERFSRDRKPVPLPSQVNIQKDRSVVTMMPSRFYPT